MTTATVHEINGELVLNDPLAASVIRAVSKKNCETTFDGQSDRVVHFKRRIVERGDSPADVCIVLINVDDNLGCDIADALMPGADWQQYRDMGQTPFARGIVSREWMVGVVALVDAEASEKLHTMNGVVVVVVDHGVVEIFQA